MADKEFEQRMQELETMSAMLQGGIKEEEDDEGGKEDGKQEGGEEA
jgi:hypothetical protein